MFKIKPKQLLWRKKQKFVLGKANRIFFSFFVFSSYNKMHLCFLRKCFTYFIKTSEIKIKMFKFSRKN